MIVAHTRPSSNILKPFAGEAHDLAWDLEVQAAVPLCESRGDDFRQQLPEMPSSSLPKSWKALHDGEAQRSQHAYSLSQ